MGKQKKKYTVGTWNDMPNYECNECQFASLREREIEKHIRREHSTPQTKEFAEPEPKQDRFGNTQE